MIAPVIRALLRDRAGGIWVGGRDLELLRFEGGAFTPIQWTAILRFMSDRCLKIRKAASGRADLTD
jgi:hypothetical protein